MNITRRQWLATSAALLAPHALPAFAQAWPARPIRLISPYGAGGRRVTSAMSYGTNVRA